jgi:hypothetical protein
LKARDLFSSEKGDWMVFASLWLIFSLVVIASSERCQDEEPLPSTLDFNDIQDYHLHGEFKTNFSSVQSVFFSLKELSYFRISLNELNIADVDILLMQGDAIIGHSMNIFEQEMIAEVLPAGNYSIDFHTFAFASHVDEDDLINMCQTVTVEIAVSPVTLTKQRRSSLPAFRNQLVMQSFDFSPLSQGFSVTFDSRANDNRDAYNIQVRENRTGNYDQLFAVGRWDFEIQHKIGTNPLFQLEVSLGFDFLTGGSLFLLLDQADASGNPQCQYGDITSNSTESRPCKIGQSLIQNTNSIKTQLGSGNYSLWIYDRVGRRFKDQSGNERSPDPFSFYLHINQNHHKENAMSCAASPLPPQLSIPGLIDETGFLTFRKRVLLNLEETFETTSFTVETASLFRIWSEAHRIDVDFKLFEDGSEIARSTLGIILTILL